MFSIVTYNVLADAYVKPERYRGCEAIALEPATRRTRLLEEISAFDVDVLCLQEVELDLFRDLEVCLRDHVGHYAPKPGRPDGLATFLRISAGPVRALHYASVEPGYPHLAQIFEVDVDGRELRIGHTHLRWQPRSTAPERHLGRLQLHELLEALGTDAPRLVVGDLNALSESVVLRDAERNGLSVAARRLRPWDTALIEGRRRKLDYVLYEEAHMIPHPHPMAPLSRDRPIPSFEHPSDHLPLRVDLEWR